MIQYEWLLFFVLVLALAVVDLVRTRRGLRRSRAQSQEEASAGDRTD